MKEKVTIQDIADALGISRNTVSKAINNSEGIAEATRNKILQKAVEMGYKQFSYVASLTNLKFSETDKKEVLGEIVVLTTTILGNSHFAASLVDKIHEEINQLGYSLTICRVSKESVRDLTLPRTVRRDRTSGIICIEIFDPAYSDMICDLNIPVLFVDGPVRKNERSVRADQLMMENYTEITHFVNMMIDRKLTKIGFIGNNMHCQSFWERYCAYRTAMALAGIEAEERYMITNIPDRSTEELAERLESLEEMPDAFVCANDFVALDAMQLLAQKDRTLLEKVRFLGFDDSHESRIFYPALSTVHIHSQAMAFSALHLLMTRIEEPTMEYRTIYVATDLALRESTEF
ncbi:MAG: LacI family DNA-binding transcriptional regulator [Erysipelotrichaceae bacterium]|nr:LacI family DNA-binding transcriptional regulator [Erysipelotrichaceae bacterium]